MDYAKISDAPQGWANDRLHFYKYMSAATAKIVLTNRTLRWSAPSQFNDPFDIQFNMRVTAEPDQVMPLARSRMLDVIEGRAEPKPGNMLGQLLKVARLHLDRLPPERLMEGFEDSFREGFSRLINRLPEVNAEAAKLLSDAKILCLTVRPDNNLMWAHYASSHQGVVLRFRSIPAFDTPYGMAKAVSYVDKVPPLVSAEELADILAGVGTFSEAGILDRAVYTKSVDWAYEEEWRINSGVGRKPGEPFEDAPFGHNDLDGLIFGLRTSDADREELLQLSKKYPNVEVLQASRSDSEFGIRIS